MTVALPLLPLPAARGSAAPTRAAPARPTVVLVHGAWADASGWNGVIARLQKAGYPTVAPANPLRSLSGDAAYIGSVLAQTPGPIVLVGHSYGGGGVPQPPAGNPNVKALVYVDAFIPAVGEDVLHLAGDGSRVPSSIEFRKYPPFGAPDIDVYLKRDAFRSTFAQDLPARRAALMAAEQRPLALGAGAEPTTAAAWMTIPSYAVVGTRDRTIVPPQQLFMAKRAGAKIVRVAASHVSMISHPGAVAKLIQRAAKEQVR